MWGQTPLRSVSPRQKFLDVAKAKEAGGAWASCKLNQCTRSQISEPEVRGFMFWKNVPSQPKMTDPSYAAWIDSQAICP